MDSLRKWFYKPKRDDRSLLAQFFFADEALNLVAAELDSFDGRENPERCSTLVNQLRHCQERVLNITGQIMDQLLGSERVPRGFRVKFPEDVLHENLAGQLWFGAECLAAGSSIMHREGESEAMRPLARALTLSLEKVRGQLRDHCLRCNRYGAPSPQNCTENLYESLKIFDRLFAEFELCYVSAMVPVKTPQEFEMQQLICVLFSETLQRARKIGLLTQEQIDDYDPALMFAIPRLAIVSGLLIFSNGPLSIDKSPELMSDMFRPFRSVLYKIRELLWTLDRRELYLLEKLLCTNEDIANIRLNADLAFDGTALKNLDSCYSDISEFVTRFYSDYSHCGDMLNQIGSSWNNDQRGTSPSLSQQRTNENESNINISDADYLPENIEILSPLIDGLKRLNLNRNDSNESDPNVTNSQAIDNTSLEKDVVNSNSNICEDNTTFHSQDNVHLNLEFNELVLSDNINEDFDKNVQQYTNIEESSGMSSQSGHMCNSQPKDPIVKNLSSEGLLLFDPLVDSSPDNVNTLLSDSNVTLLESNLVSNISESVPGSTDWFPSTSNYEDSENGPEMKNMQAVNPSISNLLHNQLSGQIFSFSTSDVSNLVPAETDPEFDVANNVTYSPSRNDKVLSQTSMPSTSHGYLILNAISHEPVILASLSNNNPEYEDSLLNSMTQTSNTIQNNENDAFEDSISVANANLTCLLLTNEDFHDAYVAQGLEIMNNFMGHNSTLLSQEPQNYYMNDEAYSSSNTTATFNRNESADRNSFLDEYESDSNDQTPADSGICTENTSLDRSPDSEVKDLDDNKTNKGKPSPVCQFKNNKTKVKNANKPIENSANRQENLQYLTHEDCDVKTNLAESSIISLATGDSICINYCEDTENVQKNDAGPSNRLMQAPEFIQSHSNNTAKTSDIRVRENISISKFENENYSCDSNLCSYNPENIKVSNVESENSDVIPKEKNLHNSYDNVNNESCDNNINIDNLEIHNSNERIIAPIEENSTSRQNQLSCSPVVVINGSPPDNCENPTETTQNVPENSSTSVNSVGVLYQRKLRKKNPKSKKRSSKTKMTTSKAWPSERLLHVIKSYSDQDSQMKLNLDQLGDECAGGSCSSQSSATSSFHSDWADDEEIALALQAHEFASRHQTRAKFRSSEDLIHRLFVCIAGVADQLQTNFASDLRNILKSVFLMNQTPEVEEVENDEPKNDSTNEATEDDQNENQSNKRRSSAIEYEVSASEIMTNGNSFDSIHSAEEVYADNNSPRSQRSRQSSRLSDSNIDESMQNNLNERSDSQNFGQSDGSEQLPSDQLPTERRNTISSVISESKHSPRGSPPGESKNSNMGQLSNRSSSSSLESNHSGNQHNDHLISTDQRLNDIPGDNYINERTNYRNQNEIITENSCIRERTLRSQSSRVERAPEWVPDIAAPDCMRCGAHFTAFRRRHHCRNCGKVFCASCSANSIPLPRFGQLKPVRVCEECFQLIAKRTCTSRHINAGGRQANYTHS